MFGRSTMTRALLTGALATATLASPALADEPVHAEPSTADKETARDYLIAGRKKLEVKDYQGALKPLKAAHAIMNVPTTGLDYARALEGLGQLIEARAVVLAVTRLPARNGEPEAFADARVAAAALADRLATRIASVVVALKGLPPGVEPKITLDGAPVPAATLGLPRKVDPGAHVVSASAPGFTTMQKRVELRDGETLPVELVLFKLDDTAPAPPAPAPGPRRVVALPPPAASASPEETRRVPAWAWITGGIGVAALGAGAGFAVDYASVRSAVTTACPGDVCQGHLPEQYGHWNRDSRALRRPRRRRRRSRGHGRGRHRPQAAPVDLAGGGLALARRSLLMTVLDRAGRTLAVVLALVVAPAAVAVSCAPDLRVVNGTGGAAATMFSTASTGGSGGTGTGGSTAGAGGGSGGRPVDGGSDASDAGSDSASDAGSDAPDDAGSDGESDASDSGVDAGGDAGADSGSADAADGGCGDTDGDPTNCGRCGHDCCGGTCAGGVCQSHVLSEGSTPGAIAVDQGFVYWPDAQGTADGGIMRAPKTGGPAITLTPGQNNPYAVAVDSTYVYWVTYSTTAPFYGGVFKAPVAGGSVLPVVPTGEQSANALVVNATSVYWDDYTSNLIRGAGLDGSAPTTLANAADGVGSPLLMAIDGQFVYWGDRFGGGTIQKAPLVGGGIVNISTGTDPVAVAVNSVNVYWANYSSGTIQKAPLGGGTATVVATSGGNGAWSIAADGTNVYWGSKGSVVDGGTLGAVRAAPANGSGALGTVLAESPNPLYIAIDATCVYWADSKNGNIGVVAKP